MRMILVALVLIISSLPSSVSAADPQGQLMFILDASSSMLAKDGGSSTRIDKAKAALKSSLSSVPSGVEAGLRVYGSRVPDSSNKSKGCQDTQLLNPPKAGNTAAISSSIDKIQAKGWTPIGKSLQAVGNDFKGEGPKSVILISDGIDTCSPPDPCEIAKELAAKDIKVKINTLGLVVNNSARDQLSCIAGATGGSYFDVNDINSLKSVISALTVREANLFSAQGVPVKGEPRIENAPLLLPNTSYTDDIVGGEELYYAFEVLPEQEITITVKADNKSDNLGISDQLILDWNDVKTDKQVNIGRDPEQFTNFADGVVKQVVLKATAPQSLKKPGRFAAKIALEAEKDGKPVPLEIKVTTKGGVAPDNKSSEVNEPGSSGSKNSKSNWLAPALIGAGVPLLLAAIAFVIYRLKKKSKKPTDPENL